jgi:flagellar basal-body rod modification protein FlgD
MSAGAINGVGSASASFGADPYSDLTSADFIKVMLSELSNQDPLDPQDSGKLLEQLSSLRNIESQLKLQEKLEDLVLQDQVASAASLIGKLVAGLDETNEEIEGLVTSVRVVDGQAFLELDNGKNLPIDRVTDIFAQQGA